MHSSTQNSSLAARESESQVINGLGHPFALSRSGPVGERDYLKNAEWTLAERSKYFAFIELNSKKMEGRPHRKLWPLYEEMGKFVKSRNFRQCKSFHQKMVDAHETIPEIMSYLVSCHSGIEKLA